MRINSRLAGLLAVSLSALLLHAAGTDSVSQQLAAAVREEHAGNPEEAAALCREILRSHPDSAEAHNWLGVALADKSNLLEAIAEYRKAVALAPQSARFWTNLGSTLAKSGEVAESVHAFTKALACDASSVESHMNLALALRENGDAKAAVEQLRFVAGKLPRDARVQYELGQTLRQSGDTGGALAAFEAALRIDPELREAYYNLGTTLKQIAAQRRSHIAGLDSAGAAAYERARDAFGRGDLREAKEQASQSVRADPAFAEAHNLLGFILGQERDLQGAIEHLNRAVELRPNYAEAHYNLGVALWYSDSRDKAIAELQESTRQDPAAGETYAFLGSVLEQTGNLAAAGRNLQRAVALLPPLPSVFVDLGLVFLHLSDVPHALGQFDAALNLPAPGSPVPAWQRAVNSLREAVAKDSKDAELHNVLGRMMGRAGSDANAVKAEFREAIRLKPDFAEAQNNLGLVLTQSSEDEGAIAAFREAIRIAPNWADAHANLGAVLTITEPAEAVKELEEAVKLEPSSIKAQYNLALAYEASPQDGAEKAIGQLRKVVAAAPDFARAHLALGRSLLSKGAVQEAIDQLQTAAHLDSSLGQAHYQLGLALSRAGRQAEALPELQKGRELAASDAKQQQEQLATPRLSGDSRQVEVVEDYIRAADFQKAETVLRDFLREQPNSSWGWYALGYCQFAQQRIGDSIQSLAKSLQLNERDPEAHKILGRDLMIIGRFDGARREFEEGIRLNAKSAELHYDLGKLFSIDDNWGLAKRELQEAVRLDPAYVEGWDALGFAAEALGDDAGALADYQRAISLNDSRKGRFASAHVNLSAYYNRTENPEKALAYAKAALDLNPRNDRAWFQMARAYERRGDLDAAVDSARHAIDLNSHASSYYYVLSTLYRRLGKTGESRQALEQFSRLDRESSELDSKRRQVSKGAVHE